MIRPATDADCPAIAAIWNAVIRDTVFTFTTQEKTPAGLRDLLADCTAEGRGLFVAVQGGDIAGFATYAPFRPGPGYAHTMEHSVHVADGARGQGIGRALMAALETHARSRGTHVMIAAISAPNGAARAFHTALGYAQAGSLPQVGFKSGKWLDLVLMHKRL